MYLTVRIICSCTFHYGPHAPSASNILPKSALQILRIIQEQGSIKSPRDPVSIASHGNIKESGA
ncbi:hypothetical protein CPB85DRAFT_1285280 [Mucidula mucida]|nr:hypothetical protein CPB85DRAFT_1285280 [Mucidula mucida]